MDFALTQIQIDSSLALGPVLWVQNQGLTLSSKKQHEFRSFHVKARAHFSLSFVYHQLGGQIAVRVLKYKLISRPRCKPLSSHLDCSQEPAN